MDINNETKPVILIDILKDRYDAMHRIRERVQTFAIWALGLLLAASAWLMQSESISDCLAKIPILVAIALTHYVVRFRYLADLQTGFKGQQRLAAKVEEALGFYEEGAYVKDGSLFDPNWRTAGTRESLGSFFQTAYALLNLGIVFLVVSVFFSGAFSSTPEKHEFEHQHRTHIFIFTNGLEDNLFESY